MYTRTNPYLARIKERFLLTKAGSTKKTYHLALEIDDTEISFNVGDSVGILPTNHPGQVEKILRKLGSDGKEEIFDKRSQSLMNFREYLLKKANIQKCSFHKLFPVEKTALPLIELVEEHKPHPSELCRILLPLLPRFYSIASSPKVFPNEMHLTVAYIEYEISDKIQYGVGSHFLCKRAEIESTSIPIYIQPSNHFLLP